MSDSDRSVFCRSLIRRSHFFIGCSTLGCLLANTFGVRHWTFSALINPPGVLHVECGNIQVPMQIETVDVLGVGISVLDQDRARDFLFDAVRRGIRGYVAVTGVHGVTEAQRDAGLRDVLNRALLVTPDGMPMVWMGKLQGQSSIQRVYGPDLVLNLCEHSIVHGFSHFLYGGVPGVAEQLQQELASRFPGLKIVGTYTPPFRELTNLELADLQERVRICRPDFFWVGLSTPKQERFMARHISMLPDAKIFIGVGAAFDLLVGRVRQAPRWMQRSGLEWLFRFTQEPRRLWKRYLINNPLFVIRAGAQLLGLRRNVES
jgi:N-acetylglucosaminyldiphosphoundecaprenol N-acetyl-beta-D-mannosaminyltransferase